MERAVVAQPPREEAKSWWQKLTDFNEEQRVQVGPDLVLTLDYDLQKAAFDQLQGKRGAVVMRAERREGVLLVKRVRRGRRRRCKGDGGGV